MKLPQQFLDKMKNLLENEEYLEFIDSYNNPRYYGLRVNTLKISVEDFLKISPFELEPIPWTKDGFYYKEGENPGKHPYYYAGLYYIQEPSAMLPGTIIDAQPGENVLDLCAAPGGKTVQIGAAMKGQGLLVSNDISSDRVKALIKNIELYGIKNAIVTNDTPEKLAINFREFFDRILVDAPCSGEGMFRKDEDAAKSWENFKNEKCANMQRTILDDVDKMLKPGGYLVYSTCTFSPEENELMIDEFMNKFPHYEMIQIPKIAGIDSGRSEWGNGNKNLDKTARLWPHKVKGEGHFVALLRKLGEKTSSINENNDEKLDEIVDKFVKDYMNIDLRGFYKKKGNNLYNIPVQYPNLDGIKVAKFGWYIGEILKDRFEPSHSLLTALSMRDIKMVVNFDGSSRDVSSYLKGETVMIEGQKGYAGICVDGYTLGWAKQTGDMLKNLYPKGWRKAY